MFIGIDVGTTSISLVVLNPSTGSNVQTISVVHKADLPSDGYQSSLQNPKILFDIVCNNLRNLSKTYQYVDAIGITGQMHGIILINKDGEAISPAYTWLDGRSEWIGEGSISYCKELEGLYGHVVPQGYGVATLYTLMRCGELPSEARALTTIPAYIAMRLAGKAYPEMGQSLAQSLGWYSLKECQFLPLWDDVLPLPAPAILPPATIIGTVAQGAYKNTPIVTPEGDNQAGFLASVRDFEKSLLFNIGTSSQVSFVDAQSHHNKAKNQHNEYLEQRPFLENRALWVGAGLSGGKSFEVLASFIQEIALQLGLANADPYTMFHELERPSTDPLFIDTAFAGTRLDAQQRGAIAGITASNFTLPRIYWGIAEGVIRELCELMGNKGLGSSILKREDAYAVISGNAGEKSAALGTALAYAIKRPVRRLMDREAAARGMAILGATYREGGIHTVSEVQNQIIRYSDEI